MELGIAVKPWTPDAPYLKTLKAAGATGAYTAYLAERESYATTPAFYLDCAELLLQLGRREEGLRVLVPSEMPDWLPCKRPPVGMRSAPSAIMHPGSVTTSIIRLGDQ